MCVQSVTDLLLVIFVYSATSRATAVRAVRRVLLATTPRARDLLVAMSVQSATIRATAVRAVRRVVLATAPRARDLLLVMCVRSATLVHPAAAQVAALCVDHRRHTRRLAMERRVWC